MLFRSQVLFADRKLRITYYNQHNKQAGDYSIGKIVINNQLYEDNHSVIKRIDIELLESSVEHNIEIALV